LAVGSLYYMPLHPRTCALLYSVSCLLDALDGFAARYFDQSTKFGAVLDMITDRCTTACLLVFLASAWPRWSIVFQGLIALDFASHCKILPDRVPLAAPPASPSLALREARRSAQLVYEVDAPRVPCYVRSVLG
jgi:hypothetical protein